MIGLWLMVAGIAGVLPGPGAGFSDSAQVTAERVGPASCGLPTEPRVGQIPSFPACVDVELAAEATGLPPLEYTWSLPDGTVLRGPSPVLDTGQLGPGFQEIRLEVRNAYGATEHPVLLRIESLGFAGAPTLTPLGDGRVEMRANTTGATEWRWTWGDGTASGWLSGCPGYAPTHVYPGPGLYDVTVEARSCREGPFSWSGTLEVRDGVPPEIRAFRVVCPTAPFCTVETGEAVGFEVELAGEAAVFAYDWDGDGVDDQLAGAPVAEHRFESAGFFTPRLTVVGSGASDVAFLEAPVAVIESTGGGDVLFSDGFESGDLRHWEVP